MSNQKDSPLERILQDVSAQLDQLCTHAAQLEDTVSEVLAQNSNISVGLILEMQALDGVNQGLHDMAVLTGLLAQSAGTQTVSADQAKAICDAVKLSTTKALFCTETAANIAGQKTSPPSGLNLF